MTHQAPTPSSRVSMTQGDLYSLVQKIPRGKVASYGWLGKSLGVSPRLVGRYLHQNPDSDRTPCHRVVKSDGLLASGYAFGGLQLQRQLLEREGVVFTKNRVGTSSFVTDLNQ